MTSNPPSVHICIPYIYTFPHAHTNNMQISRVSSPKETTYRTQNDNRFISIFLPLPQLSLSNCLLLQNALVCWLESGWLAICTRDAITWSTEVVCTFWEDVVEPCLVSDSNLLYVKLSCLGFFLSFSCFFHIHFPTLIAWKFPQEIKWQYQQNTLERHTATTI